MNEKSIQLTKVPLELRVAATGLLVIATCAVVTFFFARFVQRAPQLQVLLISLLWIAVPLLWLGGSAYALKSWPKRSYKLSDTALIATKKELFGARTEELYRYETILSIKTKRNFLGNSLILTLAQLPPVIIRDVVDPDKEARRIKSIIAAGQPKVQAFV